MKYAAYDFPKNAKNPNSKGQTPTTGGWMFSIGRAAKDQEAAWEWIKFTTISQNACKFVEKQEPALAGHPMQREPGTGEGQSVWPVVTANLQNNISVPTTSVEPQFEQIEYDMLDAILFERSSPKEALEQGAQKAQALLDDWNSKRKTAESGPRPTPLPTGRGGAGLARRHSPSPSRSKGIREWPTRALVGGSRSPRRRPALGPAGSLAARRCTATPSSRPG